MFHCLSTLFCATCPRIGRFLGILCNLSLVIATAKDHMDYYLLYHLDSVEKLKTDLAVLAIDTEAAIALFLPYLPIPKVMPRLSANNTWHRWGGIVCD